MSFMKNLAGCSPVVIGVDSKKIMVEASSIY